MVVPSLLVQFYRSSGFDSVAGKPNYVSEDEARFAIEGGLSLFNRLCNRNTPFGQRYLTTAAPPTVSWWNGMLPKELGTPCHYGPDGEVVQQPLYRPELMKQLYGTRNRNGEIVLPLHSDDNVAPATIEIRIRQLTMDTSRYGRHCQCA